MDGPREPVADRIETRRVWLDAHRGAVRSRRDDLAAHEARASWARLVVFILAVLVWIFLAAQPLIAGALTALLVMAFVVAVRRHIHLRAEREYCDRILLVAEESGRRLGGAVVVIRDWRQPQPEPEIDAALPQLLDDGPNSPLTPQERDDLDLFAPPVGVFGLLNRTSTAVGARRLTSVLMHPLVSAAAIRDRQRAADTLCGQPQARLSLLAACAALRGEDERLGRFVRAVRGATPLRLPVPLPVLRAWSLLTTAACVAACVMLAMRPALSVGALLAIASLNGLFVFQMRRRLDAALCPWRDIAWVTSRLLDAACRINAALPAQPRLNTLRRSFQAVAQRHVLPSVTRRVNWADGGGAVRSAFNLVALFDVHVAAAIVRRVVPRRECLLASISAAAELEMLLSLVAFAWEQPRTCNPQPSDVRSVRITGGCHPLIEPARAVPNDARLDPASRLWIVTGSNMAGKSTFLRMVGVNTLLAQIGCAAIADAMSWSPVRLVSDLRASDNLADNESYFLAEVRHLRRMVSPSSDDVPLLGLIDEPFRGTNSEEQTAASIAVVQHLLGSGHLFLLATHDRELTHLADGNAARNFHFRENLGADGMVFDYRLHTGPATTRNALRVLEREAYPDQLLRQARAWLQERHSAHEGVRPGLDAASTPRGRPD